MLSPDPVGHSFGTRAFVVTTSHVGFSVSSAESMEPNKNIINLLDKFCILVLNYKFQDVSIPCLKSDRHGNLSDLSVRKFLSWH